MTQVEVWDAVNALVNEAGAARKITLTNRLPAVARRDKVNSIVSLRQASAILLIINCARLPKAYKTPTSKP